MEIKTIKSKFLRNMFDQNTYVLINKNDAVIIDAGAELDDVVQAVGNKKVQAILLTHIHFDHVWNLEEYVVRFDAPVFVVQGQEKRFDDSALNASMILRQDMRFNIDQTKIKYYAEKLKLGSFDFDVIFSPGHSDDSVCLLVDGQLFSGDTLFDGGVGRTDLPDGSEKKLLESLEKIKQLKFERAYPGHYDSASQDKILTTIMFYI